MSEPATPLPIRPSQVSLLLTAAVVLGLVLRIAAYGAGTALWLDEILLSRNILELPLTDLLMKPLALDQVAPRGFLLLERLAVGVLGPTEMALRLFPFLAGVAALLLFRRLAERMLDGLAVPVAVALFALALPLIKYSNDVKQYIFDAAAAIVLLLAALVLHAPETSGGTRLRLGAMAFVVIWFSQASVIVMGGVGVAFALEWLVARNDRHWRVLTTTIPLWALASGVAVALGMQSMTPETRAFMDDFWRPGFLPAPFSPATALAWFNGQLLSFFRDPLLLRYPWPGLFLLLAIAGSVASWRRDRMRGLLLLTPLAVALLAAVARQYPFSGRLMVYLVPSLLLLVAAGVEWVRHVVASRTRAMVGAIVLVLLGWAPLAAIVRNPPPYEIEHHRTLLAYLQAHREPGDAIYVFPLTRVGMLYYGPQYGVQWDDIIVAPCHREDSRAYLRDADRLRGAKRAWLITAPGYPFRVAQPAVARYLSTIGVKRDSLVLRSLSFSRIALELYDLSDPVRLRSADAESFAVAPMPTDPRPGCRPWALPDGPVRAVDAR